MLQSFEPLREELLRAGLAPGRVRRYVDELQEHLIDLTERERASGLDSKQARGRAMALLGNDRELAQAMIEKVSSRSLAARAPWTVFVLSPLLMLVCAVLLIDICMMNLLWPVQGLTLAQMPERYRVLIRLTSVAANYLPAALLAGGCIAIALRQRVVSRAVWLGLAVIALVGATFGFHVHVSSPQGGPEGQMAYGAVALAYLHGRVSLAATLAMTALRAAVLFAIAAMAYRTLRRRLGLHHCL
jgi:hypothetical protein